MIPKSQIWIYTTILNNIVSKQFHFLSGLLWHTQGREFPKERKFSRTRLIRELKIFSEEQPILSKEGKKRPNDLSYQKKEINDRTTYLIKRRLKRPRKNKVKVRCLRPHSKDMRYLFFDFWPIIIIYPLVTLWWHFGGTDPTWHFFHFPKTCLFGSKILKLRNDFFNKKKK